MKTSKLLSLTSHRKSSLLVLRSWNFKNSSCIALILDSLVATDTCVIIGPILTSPASNHSSATHKKYLILWKVKHYFTYNNQRAQKPTDISSWLSVSRIGKILHPKRCYIHTPGI